MNKIKVLHLIKTLRLGGAETNLLNLVRATNAERFELHVGYSSGGEIEDRFKRGGGLPTEPPARLFKYAEGDHRVKSPATLGILARIAAYLLKNRIRIVHTHNFNAHLWGCLAAKIAGARVIEHVHDFRYMDAAEYRRRCGGVSQFRYIRYFKRMSDIVVVLTKDNVEYLVKNRFYPRERIREIQNGIPLRPIPARAQEVKQKLGLAGDDRMILTAARLSPEKNIGLVLDTVPAVLRRHPKACFVIAGDGPLLEELKNRCRREGLERVRFVGYQDDMLELLSAAEIFVLPSFLELHSIAILEAMSAGVPVLVSAGVGCNDEFITPWVNGVLADPFDSGAWTEAVDRLLSDEPLRRKIGESGRALCRERFDIRRTAEKFEALYEELHRR